MASNQSVTYRFSWGEAVEVVADAPERYTKVQKGSVCGMREIDTARVAASFNGTVGSVLYLVEGATGETIEIPERFLTSL